MPPARKCTYLVRGRVCGKKADGNPPLCDDHYDELHGPDTAEEMVDEFLDDVLDSPQVQGVFGRVSGFIDKFSYLVDRAATPKTPKERREAVRDAFQATRAAAGRVADSARPAPAGKPKPTPRPPLPKRPAPGEDPMVVLGFAAGTALTVEGIKIRYKALAQIYHSDKGGSDEAMKRLNNARDALLARCKPSR